MLGAAGFTGSALADRGDVGERGEPGARRRATDGSALALGALGGLLVAGPSLAGGAHQHRCGSPAQASAVRRAGSWPDLDGRGRWQHWVAVGVGVVACRSDYSRGIARPCRSIDSTMPCSTSATSRSVAFYTRRARLPASWHTMSGRTAAFSQAPRLDQRPRPRAVPDRRRVPVRRWRASQTVGLYHLAWEVDTLDELARVRRASSPQAGALVGASDHSTTKSLYGHDPDGLEFEIVLARAGRRSTTQALLDRARRPTARPARRDRALRRRDPRRRRGVSRPA